MKIVQHSDASTLSTSIQPDYDWLNYFNPLAALKSVAAHIAGLASTRKTPEQHTSRMYQSSLRYLLTFLAGDQLPPDPNAGLGELASRPLTLPTEAVMREYLAHLSLRGLKSTTIKSKYLTPARHFIKALGKQRPHVTPEERNRLEDYRGQMTDAAELPAPPKEESSVRAPAYRYGHRLTITQINDLLAMVARQEHPLKAARDLAMVYVAITTALRVAELSRMTLNSITQGDGCYEITVRGKRNQIDPVAADSTAIKLIKNWVDLWNDSIDDPEDPRHIHRDTPIWQAIHHNGSPAKAHTYNPTRGIRNDSVRDVIKKYGQKYLGVDLAPHDLRRTYATRASEAGGDRKSISRQLRHARTSTTDAYIGEPENLSAGLFTKMVPIRVPA